MVLFIVIVVILLVLYMFPNIEHEGFETVDKKTEDISIKPLLYEPEKGIITAGSEFIGLPDEIIPPWGENDNYYGEMEILDDGEKGRLGLHFNMCSKSCCSPQYPPSFAMEKDEMVCKNKNNFVQNNYNCNNSWQSAGCVCMTQKQRDFLNNRGGNA